MVLKANLLCEIIMTIKFVYPLAFNNFVYYARKLV